MSKLLIFLTLAEKIRHQYRDKIQARFPDLDIAVAGTREEAGETIGDADFLLTFGAMMRDEIFQKAKSLKWVHALGTGVDGIVDQPSLGPDVVVSATRGIHGKPMSEMAFLLMLALSRDFPRTLMAQEAARWERWPAKLLDNKTAGILGVGLIAEELAPRCKAFGMEVIGISQTERNVPGIDRFVTRDALNDAVPEIDYLIVLVPYDETTHNLIDGATFKAMKPNSYLINIARGGVVDEAALVAALNAGDIAGAGLDTFVDEPLPSDNPLWKTPNTIITPHLGGFNDAYPDHAMPQFENNLRFMLDGQPDRMINLERR
ncbi:MAG: D-2-hydroxyacid dehydrogenase [Rhodospirillaceae bacterium]|jgi:D-2-hydroxyacid dehydrogenase (NADP+)|nr:D-2-hydroxyacid dehydrogenase [Rhodospirillaceae bacterium]